MTKRLLAILLSGGANRLLAFLLAAVILVEGICRQKDMRTFVWFSFGWALAASLFLMPILAWQSPWWWNAVVRTLLVPLLLAAVPFLLMQINTPKVIMLVITLISALGLTTSGWFYFPSAVLMLTAFVRGLVRQ